MEQEIHQVTVDHTASLRLANLAVIVVVWLGWTVYSVIAPLVDLVPPAWGPYFIIAAIIGIMVTIVYYSLVGDMGFAVAAAVGFSVIVLVVGVAVVDNLQSSLSTTGLTAEQGQQITNVFSSSLGTLAILPIILIVVAAIVIMFLLMNFATGRYTAAME